MFYNIPIPMLFTGVRGKGGNPPPLNFDRMDVYIQVEILKQRVPKTTFQMHLKKQGIKKYKSRASSSCRVILTRNTCMQQPPALPGDYVIAT